jgi:LysM repeat protein
MEKRNPAPARVLAITALVAGFLVLIVVVSTSFSGNDSKVSRNGSQVGTLTERSGKGGGKAVAVYVVQNGDTLTSIAHKTGVSVDRIQRLNPDVDPQILISGEKLQLR